MANPARLLDKIKTAPARSRGSNKKECRNCGKERKDPKDQKPFYKKWWFWVIVVVLVGAAGSGLSGGNEPVEPSTSQTGAQDPDLPQEPSGATETGPAETAPGQDADQVEGDNSIQSGRYTLPSQFEINFNNSVRNDVTGNWRISATSDSFVPAEYAVEYYETMFSSGSEVHAIWNATLGTTTRITVASGIIFADTFEYVKGEEHDAKLLFSGQLLDSKMFDAETGEEIFE